MPREVLAHPLLVTAEKQGVPTFVRQKCREAWHPSTGESKWPRLLSLRRNSEVQPHSRLLVLTTTLSSSQECVAGGFWKTYEHENE